MRIATPPRAALFALAMVLADGVASRVHATSPADLLAEALDAARAGDWTEADALAARTRDPVASDILLWARLRDGGGSWEEYQAFLGRDGAWPSMSVIRRSAERLIPEDMAPERVTAFFYVYPPQTGTGALRLAAALMARGEGQRAEAVVARAWRELSLSGAEQKLFRAEWSGTIKPHHEARLDNLLWQGWTNEATAMLPLVDPDWQALARARIATRRDEAGLQSLIQAVPKRFRRDPGLAYERYLYRVNKGRWDEAEEYLLEKSTSAEALGRPDMWMPRRANLARQALQRGAVKDAYRLASQSFGSGGADYADSEWYAGFLALTRMNDPQLAIGHFERFQEVVFTPISLGRAGYWLGLAHERAGDPVAARAAYLEGARHQTSFYGQLAAERAGILPDPALAGGADVPDWKSAAFMQASVVRAVLLLDGAGDEGRMAQFLRQAAEGRPAEERAALAQMAADLGRPHVGLRVAKDAAAAGMVLPDQYYPLHPIAKRRWPVPAELAMAVARQESELNPRAASDAGARGLMQLMPATAKGVAEAVGLRYDVDRLVEDPNYNARLGTAYLARMLQRYRGSYVLAVAAYNAGPGRVDQWIEANGDPREREVDGVVWIESIPFSETRNYVMRVLEGLQVYRARLHGGPLWLVADIHGTG
jgi:soluble lytic murein transglycosylase